MTRPMLLALCLLPLAGTCLAAGPVPSIEVRVPTIRIEALPKISPPGRFQRRVANGAAVGGAAGSAFGSPGGPAGSAGGWAGGAVIGSTYVIVDNHARKKWNGAGWANWNESAHW